MGARVRENSVSVPAPARESIGERWDRFWFRPIPPHVFALLRILLGGIACLSLIGLLDLPLFWSCDGLVANGESPACTYLRSSHLGWLLGYSVLAVISLSFLAMTVGWKSRAAVVAAFVSVFLMGKWNTLPFSSAHQVLRCMLFGLMWADSGTVWSVDAWLAKRRTGASQPVEDVPVWPLQLMRIQVAAIYLITGLWKLNNATWRDGSALHYVYESPQFRRFSTLALPWFDSWTTVATYATLAWELAFAFLVMHPRTRRWALWFGVLAHLGMWATLELGPFSWVMLASYAAFLEPDRVRRLIGQSN